MDSNVLLHLVLSGVGLELCIESQQDRLNIQKAVYLVQACGLHLGYPYSWYKMGPYSPELTKDYYAAKEKTFCPTAGWQLNPVAAGLVERAKSLMTPPRDVDSTDWREALASVHFAFSNFEASAAEGKLAEKAHLDSVVPLAKQALVRMSLLKPNICPELATTGT